MAAELCDVLRRFEEYRRTWDRDLRNVSTNEYRWIAVHCARRFQTAASSWTISVRSRSSGCSRRSSASNPIAASSSRRSRRRRSSASSSATSATRGGRCACRGGCRSCTSSSTGRWTTSPGARPSAAPAEIAQRVGVSRKRARSMEAGSAYRLARPVERRPTRRRMPPTTAARSAPTTTSMPSTTACGARCSSALPRARAQDRVPALLRGPHAVEIADRVGISQMHVSRLLQSSLQQLQRGLGPADDTAVAG